jgi:hypothetical protein
MLLPLLRYFRGRLGGGDLTNAPSIAELAAMPCRIKGICILRFSDYDILKHGDAAPAPTLPRKYRGREYERRAAE